MPVESLIQGFRDFVVGTGLELHLAVLVDQWGVWISGACAGSVGSAHPAGSGV